MCTTTSASDGETTCTRADPGPDVIRWTDQCDGHLDSDASLDQQRHRHPSTMRFSRVATRREPATQRRRTHCCTGEHGQPATVAVDWHRRIWGRTLILMKCEQRRRPALHAALVGDRDRGAVDSQAISDGGTYQGSSVDAGRNIHQRRRRRTDPARHLLRQGCRVTLSRYNGDVASWPRDDDELGRDLHHRRQPVTESFTEHFRSVQHDDAHRESARRLAYNVDARR